MKSIFNYNKFNNETQDTLVESFGALVNSYMDGKGNTPAYQEANKQFNEAFMTECFSAIPNHGEFSLDMMKNPMIHGDMCAKCF